MKKKNLGLKIAALLLACGSFGAINAVSNSAFAMEKNPSSNLNQSLKEEQKKYQELYRGPVGGDFELDPIDDVRSIKLPDLDLNYDELLPDRIRTPNYLLINDLSNAKDKPFLDPSAIKRTLTAEDIRNITSTKSDELSIDSSKVGFVKRNFGLRDKLTNENPTANNQSLNSSEVNARVSTENENGETPFNYNDTSLESQLTSIDKLIDKNDAECAKIDKIQNKNMEIGEVKLSGDNITNEEVKAVKNFVEEHLGLNTFRYNSQSQLERITLDEFKKLYYTKYARLYNERVKDVHAIKNYLKKLKFNIENNIAKKAVIAYHEDKIKEPLAKYKERLKNKYQNSLMNCKENLGMYPQPTLHQKPTHQITYNQNSDKYFKSVLESLEEKKQQERQEALEKEREERYLRKQQEEEEKQLKQEEEAKRKKIEALSIGEQQTYYATKEEIDKTKKQLAKAQKEWENDDDYDPFEDNEEIKKLEEKLDDLENTIKNLLGENERDE